MIAFAHEITSFLFLWVLKVFQYLLPLFLSKPFKRLVAANQILRENRFYDSTLKE